MIRTSPVCLSMPNLKRSFHFIVYAASSCFKANETIIYAHNSVLGSNRDNLGKSLPSPVSLIIPRGEYVSVHVVCPFASDTSPGELTEKAWENAVKGLGQRKS